MRKVIYLSAGGRSVWVRLSNTFGTRPVQVGHASIAVQAAGAPAGTGYVDNPCWIAMDGVDVEADARVTGTVVALGDSITDTASTTGNANRRWPDALARRLNAQRGKTLLR